MESLHVIVPAITSDNMYDVTNPVHTSHGDFMINASNQALHAPYFWHPPTPPLFPQNVGEDLVRSSLESKTDNSINFQEKRAFQELRPVMKSAYNTYSTSSDVRNEVTSSSRLSGRRDKRTDSETSDRRDENKEWSCLPEETVDDPNDDNPDDNDDVEDPDVDQGKSTPDDTGTPSKESQVVTTLKWLSENYELSEGVCLPRCVLYLHYLDFCKRQALKPSGAATFGKLIRQKFKNITTRRLGTRGQSKYHYYGIGIKESSIYYQSVYTGKGLTRFSGVKIKTEGSTRKYSLSSKTGTLLPDFPNARNLILPDDIIIDKMNTFIMMYRTHSQRILDTVITANFEDIQNLLIHFWQGYPQHLLDVLQLPVTADVIAICDSILYKVLIDVLVPNTIQDFPDSLSSDLRSFLRSLPKWVDNSLDDFVPDIVKEVKQKAIQGFLRCIKRQLSFVRMAQTARPHLANTEVTGQAVKDLQQLDFPQVCVQTGFALNNGDIVHENVVTKVFEDLKTMLQKQTQVENVIEWLDNLLDKYVLKGESAVPAKFRQRAGKFLLQWTMFGALIMKDLTLNKAKSFTFLHLMKLTMDEYIFLVIETQADKIQDTTLKKNLQGHMKNAEEIHMNATVRNQSSRSHASPKIKKRKAEEIDRNDGENESLETINETIDTPCQDSRSRIQTPPTTSLQPIIGTAFFKPRNTRDTPTSEQVTQSWTATSSNKCSDVLCPPSVPVSSLPSHNISLSPMKYYPSYDRCSYIPSIGFNTYTDYINHHSYHHASNLTNTRPAAVHQTFHDHAQTQPFQPMGFSSAVNQPQPASSTYWTDNRFHHPSFSEPYPQFPYNSYQDTYDPYRKHLSPLLRSSVYHQETLACANSNFDSYQRGNLEGLSLSGSTLDCLPRHGVTFEGLTRPPTSASSYENHRSAMPYYGRPHENYQVTSNLSLPIGQGRIDITPSGGQYPKQDGLFYPTDDAFASNMAAVNPGLSAFGKTTYFPPAFR